MLPASFEREGAAKKIGRRTATHGALKVERQKTVLETRRSRSSPSIASDSSELASSSAIRRSSALAPEMGLQRLGCVAKISPPDPGQHRREDPEHPPRHHLELVIDPRAVPLGRQEEAVTA